MAVVPTTSMSSIRMSSHTTTRIIGHDGRRRRRGRSGGKHSRFRSVSRMMQRRRLVHFFVDTLSLPIVKTFF